MAQLENLVEKKVEQIITSSWYVYILGPWRRLRKLVLPRPPDSLLKCRSPPSYTLMLRSEEVVKTERAGIWLLWNHHYIMYNDICGYRTCIHIAISKARWSKMSQPLYYLFPCATVGSKLWEPPRCSLKLASRGQGQTEEMGSGW